VASLAKEELVGLGCMEPRKVLIKGLLWKKTTAQKRATGLRTQVQGKKTKFSARAICR
jgi:hypothetical protein